jgi:[acyl-carrier-protein] S-malonyltransferase
MIGLVFAGQGSETPYMGKDFYETFPEVKELYLYAEKVTNLPLREIVFSEDDERLHETLYAQILLFLFDVFVVDLLRDLKVDIALTFGLSLGEYGALYASEVFDKKTGLDIIMKRAQFMSDVCDDTQRMAAILGLEEDKLIPLLDQENVFLANYNTPKQLVISGRKDNVNKASKEALMTGAKRAVMLSSSGAFHTPFMEDASKRFGEYLEDVSLNEPRMKLLLNTTGDIYQKELKKEMQNQIVSSVYFYQSVEQAIRMGVDTFIEVAPKSVLKSMIKKVNREVNVFTVSSVDDVKEIVDLV